VGYAPAIGRPWEERPWRIPPDVIRAERIRMPGLPTIAASERGAGRVLLGTRTQMSANPQIKDTP